jgi:hypothetical protein
MSTIVEGRTTLEELDAVLGKPVRKERTGENDVWVYYYHFSAPPIAVEPMIWVREGVVAWNPYSDPKTE